MTASLETAAEFFLTPVQRPPRRTTGAADAGLRGASVTGARNGEASEQLHERIRKRIFEKDGKASYVPQDLMPGSMYREKPGSCTDASLLLLYERMQRMNHRHKQHDLEEIMFEINRQAVASESFAREYRLDTSTRGPFAEFKLRKLARTLLHRGGTPSHNDSRDASPPSWESYDNDQFTSYASTVKSTGITPGAMLIGLENHTTRAVGSASLQRKASSSKTSSRSGMPPRHSNTSRGSDGSSVGGFDVRDADNGGGGLEYDSSNAAAPFPITEWHGEMPLPMDHGVLVDPEEAFRQDREVGWNSSVLPPRSVPLIYQQKAAAAAAARSSSHLPPEDSIELPAVEAMLKTIKEHGVAGADPTNATTQTVCALFTYGQPQQRSERLQVVAPVLSRISFPSKPKSYRTILEEKILSGEIDLTNDEIRETVSGLLDSVPPPARPKKDHQKTLRSRRQLPPRSETAPPPTTTTASATTSGKTFHPKDAMKATSDPVVERASSCTPTLLDESSPSDSPIAETPSQSDPKDSNVLEMRPSAAPLVVDSNELLHSSEAAERGKVPKTREERNPAKNIKGAPAVKKPTKALPSVPAATKKAPNKNATAQQAKTLSKPPAAEVDTKPHSEPTADNASNSFVPPVAPTLSVAGCVQTEEAVTSSQMAEVQVTAASTNTVQIEQPSRVPAAVDDAPLVGQLSAVETADASQPLAADLTHAAESRKDTTEAKAVAQTAASPSPSKKKVPAVISPKARSTISNQRVEVKETSKVGYKGKSAPAAKKSKPKTETVDVAATATPAQGGEETYDDDDFAPEPQDAHHAAPSVSLTTTAPLSAKRAPPKKSPRVAASPQPKSTSPQRSGYKGKISSVKSPKAVSPPAAPSHTHIVDNTSEPDAYDDDDFTVESPNRAPQHTAVPAASAQGVAATVTATDDSEYAGTGYDDDNFEEGSPARDEVARASNSGGAENEPIDQDDDDIHASNHERDDAYDDDEFDAPPPAGADTNRQFADIGNANEDDYSSDDPAQSDHDMVVEDSHETNATTTHTPPSVISAAPPPDESEGDAYANALSLALRLRMKSKVSPRDAPPAVMLPPQEVLDMVVQSGLTSRTVSAEPQQRPDSKHRGRSRGSTAGGDSRPQYTARDFFSDDHNNSGVVDDPSMYLLRPTSRASADNRSRTPTAITPTMSDAPFSWSRSTPPPDDDDDEDRYLNDEAMSEEQRKRSKKSKKDKRKSGGGGGASVTLEGFVEIDVGMQPESSGGASSKKKRSSSKKLRNTEFEPPAIPAEPTPTGSREEGRRRRNTNKGMAFDL